MITSYKHHDLTILVLDAETVWATSTNGDTRKAAGYAVVKGTAGVEGFPETAEFAVEIDESGTFRNFNSDGDTKALFSLIESAGVVLGKTVDGDEAIADLPRHLFSALRVRQSIGYSATLGAPVGRDAPPLPAGMSLFG